MATVNQHHNARNPAVKRLLQELKEIARDDDPNIVAQALEDNIFEWHFAIRGAWGTEFEGGIYHGRILMPADYPFKPPGFVMLTPSGRWETGTKICLSISSHHPESWQPSWSVRSALVALIAFMQTPGNGALGSLDESPEVRRALAAEARAGPPRYGTPQRQALLADMHARLLESEEASRAGEPSPSPAAAPAAAAGAGDAAAVAVLALPVAPQEALEPTPAAAPPVQRASPAPAAVAAAPAAAVIPPAPAAAAPVAAPAAPVAAPAALPANAGWGGEDRNLTLLALLLALAILCLVTRRCLMAFGRLEGDDFLNLSHFSDAEL